MRIVLTAAVILIASSLAAPLRAQKPVVLSEPRLSARIAWVKQVVRPVELRIEYGAAVWNDRYAAEFDRKEVGTFRLGRGGWATLHAASELRFGKRKLPAGVYYLALQRSAEASWSLAVLEPAKVLREGVLPGNVAAVKPAMLVPMTKQAGLPECPSLAVSFEAGEVASAVDLVVRWGTCRLRATLTAEVEPLVRAPNAFAFRKLDDSKAVKTASGLRYEPLKFGVGMAPAAGEKVRTHYIGWLGDGTRFDSSLDRGEPVSFGLKQVIKGWGEALQLMSPGAVMLLEIPSDLAYGARGVGNTVPPNATLYFWVELLAVEK